mgnify:CR=1 FL=1|jgi:DNA-directed RNA polymerase subunit RPC12/RpoP
MKDYRKANLKCVTCGYELLVNIPKSIVFCQNCEKRIKSEKKTSK